MGCSLMSARALATAGLISATPGGNGFGTVIAQGNNTVTGPTHVTFGSAGAFAYQAMAGVSLPLPAVPGLSATLE